MTNWCSNTVAFEGNPEALEQIQTLFNSMAEKEKSENCGQLPEFIKDANGGHFFDLYNNEDCIGLFEYETKWIPNTEILQKIAEYYEVDFFHEYEELGNLVFGKATFRNQQLTAIDLNYAHFEKYKRDEESSTYDFEGNTYDNVWDILETLLLRKNELNL